MNDPTRPIDQSYGRANAPRPSVDATRLWVGGLLAGVVAAGVAIVGLMPMLWAHGTGAEIMRPMAAPVLGGLLVADEVIDLLLPVLFHWLERNRWRRMRGAITPETA